MDRIIVLAVNVLRGDYRRQATVHALSQHLSLNHDQHGKRTT